MCVESSESNVPKLKRLIIKFTKKCKPKKSKNGTKCQFVFNRVCQAFEHRITW